MNAAYKDYIQYALDENKPVPDSLRKNEWRGFFSFCCRQGIPGVVFSGIERANKPVPQDVILEWFAMVEGVKRQNQLVNKRLFAVSDWFKEKGYRSIILKGQANGTMYPEPELRCSGDIDIWVEGDSKNIISLVREKCPKAHYSIHHIKMPVFNDVSVEVHYRPIYLINWFIDKRLQRHIKNIEESQFNNQIFLQGKQIGSLTDDFNSIYQLLHMYAHFFSTRNSFKQFVDYYYLLKRGLSDDQKKESAALMKELKVLKYGRGMMWVMKAVLGLDESMLIVDPDEKVGKAILRESMHYGMFSTNKLRYVIERFAANFRLALMFPGQVIISPLFLVWHQWWKLKMKMELQ